VYQQALAACPGCDDALLWNADGEVTESTIANLVYRLEGQLYTPPVSCGLLPGTLRGQVLAHGAEQENVEERVLKLDELPACGELWLINSVRGWRRAILSATD
jgi:para-aminobenzoate synthetase/4-amino-4-deoxychorismate lyase